MQDELKWPLNRIKLAKSFSKKSEGSSTVSGARNIDRIPEIKLFSSSSVGIVIDSFGLSSTSSSSSSSASASAAAASADLNRQVQLNRLFEIPTKLLIHLVPMATNTIKDDQAKPLLPSKYL